MNDTENETINKSLKILLTPDGQGRKRKAQILTELVEFINPNLTREGIKKFMENLLYGEKI